MDLQPTDPVSKATRAAISQQITDFLEAHRGQLAEMSPELAPVLELAELFTSGGKRLRPAFGLWGYVAAAGLPAPEQADALIKAVASLDVLHVSALVHDDVMDASDTRRGVPAAHRQFEQRHRDAQHLGSAEDFGQAGAILLGDLLVMWSVEMLENSGLPADALARGRQVVQAMRTEVTCGQYLDTLAQRRPILDADQAIAQASTVVEYKTARYTVQRPLQFGAAVGGASDELCAALAAYGSPLGRAFQYRDDLLGVFGDERTTGKPAGDDLREGKRTLLLAHTYKGSDATQRARLDALVGNPNLTAEGVAEVRAIIDAVGAHQSVETMIDTLHAEAVAALDAPMTAEGREALTVLADLCVRRDF